MINKTTLFIVLEASPYNIKLCLATNFYLKVRCLYRIISRYFSNSARLSLGLFWNALMFGTVLDTEGIFDLNLVLKAVLFRLKVL